MITSTSKTTFGIYEHDDGNFVIMFGLTDPGAPVKELPSYFNPTASNCALADPSVRTSGWYELCKKHGINKFSVCRDLLEQGYEYDATISDRMKRIFNPH